MDKIHKFEESKSGFENRTRKEWKRMLIAIDEQKEPCILLCRDTSRLSRNPTDNLEIANRLFWDNGTKKSIHTIYFLWENTDVSEWNNKTDKKIVVDTLHDNYTNSLETKKKSMAGILLKLMAGEFPYTAPHWLSRVNKAGVKRIRKEEKTKLRQTEEMPFIKRAFEMKVEGSTAIDISKYLKQNAGISIASKKISETIIQNTVYRWEYTEKTTEKYFTNLLFWEWKPPIDKSLWDKANATLWKRGSGYGLWQEDHIAKWKLKAESWKPLHLYIARKPSGKTYRAYQSQKTNIMEPRIVEVFIDRINRLLVDICVYIRKQDLVKEKESMAKFIERSENTPWEDSFAYTQCKARWIECTKAEYLAALTEAHKAWDFDEMYERILEEWHEELWKQSSLKLIDAIGSLPEPTQAKKERTMTMEDLENKKNILERSIQSEQVNLARSLAQGIITKEIYQWAVISSQQEIESLEEQIISLSENTDIEEFIEQLPEILWKITELMGEFIQEADYEGNRENIKKLIAITTNELYINDKKELKVKLFDWLDSIVEDDKGTMEPPSGLEPETSSLPMKCSTTELWRRKFYINSDSIWSITKIQVFVGFILFSLISRSQSTMSVSSFVDVLSWFHPSLRSPNIICSISIWSRVRVSLFSFLPA